AVAAVLGLLGSGCEGKLPEPAVAGASSAVTAAPFQEPPLQAKPLSCTIHADRTCELGKAPNVKVAITNQTNADIYLVGSLDASDCKWRYPYCSFEVIGPNGNSAVQGIMRCGNMNTLREQDFVKVKPGAPFDPYQRADDYGFFSAHQLDPSNFST